MPGCGILTRRATLAQGEAQRQPLPLPFPRWISSRTPNGEATGPRCCGSSRVKIYQGAADQHRRQLRPADQPGPDHDRLRDPLQAGHVGPGRSAAAAFASSLPALDPHQDAQQQGHQAQALRISTGSSCALFFCVQIGHKKRMKKQNDT